jgi:hypothetical protein
MSDLKNRLKVFSNWLKESNYDLIDTYDGQLERVIKQSQKDTMERIGNYLDEILEMDDHSIDVELENINRRNSNPLMPF